MAAQKKAKSVKRTKSSKHTEIPNPMYIFFGFFAVVAVLYALVVSLEGFDTALVSDTNYDTAADLPDEQKMDKEDALPYKMYTVKSGDSIFQIAANELGDDSRYTEIIDLNREVYPGFNVSSVLSVGMELRIPKK